MNCVAWTTSQDGDNTTCLGSLFQSCTTSLVMKFFFMCNLNLLRSCSLTLWQLSTHAVTATSPETNIARVGSRCLLFLRGVNLAVLLLLHLLQSLATKQVLGDAGWAISWALGTVRKCRPWGRRICGNLGREEGAGT